MKKPSAYLTFNGKRFYLTRAEVAALVKSVSDEPKRKRAKRKKRR